MPNVHNDAQNGSRAASKEKDTRSGRGQGNTIAIRARARKIRRSWEDYLCFCSQRRRHLQRSFNDDEKKGDFADSRFSFAHFD